MNAEGAKDAKEDKKIKMEDGLDFSLTKNYSTFIPVAAITLP